MLAESEEKESDDLNDGGDTISCASSTTNDTDTDLDNPLSVSSDLYYLEDELASFYDNESKTELKQPVKFPTQEFSTNLLGSCAEDTESKFVIQWISFPYQDEDNNENIGTKLVPCLVHDIADFFIKRTDSSISEPTNENGKCSCNESAIDVVSPSCTVKKIKQNADHHVEGIHITLTAPCDDFIDHNNQLEELHSYLNEEDDNGPAVSVAVTGEAGIGKSELVLNYISKYGINWKYIFWIDCNNTKSIHKSILRISELLEINIEGSLINTLPLLTYIYSICNKYKCLFIFDNVNNPEDIAQYLPPFYIDSNLVKCIVTSRYNDWEYSHVIEMYCFTKHTAITYLRKHLKNIKCREAKEIAYILNNLPLALKLAVSYIKNEIQPKNLQISAFIVLLKINSSPFFSYKLPPSLHSYSDSLKEMYKNTLQILNQTELGYSAIQLLYMMAYVVDSNIGSISFHCLKLQDLENNYDITLLLKQYSFITNVGGNIKISKLTQRIFRENCTFEKELLDHILSTIENDYDVHCVYPYLLFDYCIPHVMKLWKYASTYDELVKKYECLPIAMISNHFVEFGNVQYFFENNAIHIGRVIGWNNKNLLQLFIVYVKQCLYYKMYDALIKTFDKIEKCLPDHIFNSKTMLVVFWSKCKSYKVLKQHELSWQIGYHALESHYSLCGLYSQFPLTLLGSLLETAYELYQINFDITKIDIWLLWFEVAIEFNENLERMVIILPKFELYLKSMGKIDRVLKLYIKLSFKLEECLGDSDPYSLSNSLNKAKVLCEKNQLQECWRECYTVRRLLRQRYRPYPGCKQGLILVIKELQESLPKLH